MKLVNPHAENDMGNARGPNVNRFNWLNKTVVAIAFASLFSDWSHEIATTLLPAFLATMGASAGWLGLIEGVSDGVSSFTKMISGYYTDRLPRRKPIAVAGYLITAVATASIGLATHAWHVMIARASAWLGRGIRTPVRKALLAGAVDKSSYGKAFGFERMMDTLGAVVGPATAFVLLSIFHNNYSLLFLCTLVPGLIAALLIGALVNEKDRIRVQYVSFSGSLRSLPTDFQKFLLAVGIFGVGDFAHTMLILFAVQKLTPIYGIQTASGIAVGLYMAHNVFYAGFSMIAGFLADRFRKNVVLAAGYFTGALTLLLAVLLPASVAAMALVFIAGGIYVAIEETLEDSFCAELVDEQSHGMAFGLLATVNGVGDCLSSIIVGWLWTVIGVKQSFIYSIVLFIIGAVMVLRIKKNS